MVKKSSSKATKNSAEKVLVPADVPKKMQATYIKNYNAITKGSGNLMLFAGDQKIEHLNDDFFGKDAHSDDADPEHLFRIANQGKIGVFAAQMGLIARYGKDYPKVDYLVKVNSKSPLVEKNQRDPVSTALVKVKQIVEFAKNSGLNIRGIGYTIYLGSEFEHIMFNEAAQAIYHAHQEGLVTVLWIYPRGKAVSDERDPHLIAGATGIALCLGSDFVKVNYPKKDGVNIAEAFKESVKAAGRTKVICAGGGSTDVKAFLTQLKQQLDAGACGNATGRNIHQKSLKEAVKFCNAIYALTVDKKSVDDAMKVYNQ